MNVYSRNHPRFQSIMITSPWVRPATPPPRPFALDDPQHILLKRVNYYSSATMACSAEYPIEIEGPSLWGFGWPRNHHPFKNNDPMNFTLYLTFKDGDFYLFRETDGRTPPPRLDPIEVL